MLFNSFEFLVFFPIVVCLFFGLPYRFRWVLLLVASYYFYMRWRPEYALIMAGVTLVDFCSSYLMGRIQDKKKRLPFLLFSLLTNLGILFTFKYFNFFHESVAVLAETLNLAYAAPAFSLLLPVGISFYTFQSLSYSIDVYNGQLKPEKHLGIFALFISFFPQLVAGPIERAEHMLWQFRQKHDFNYERITDGLKLMAWGLFKKVVIADRLAMMVNPVYNNPTDYDGFSLLLATVFFTFQIYCDFSGYSDMAIGAAQVMGFRLMENFRRPYFSKSTGEFWRRWHISLSTWFRDYVYIPLGGNRVVKWRGYYNLFIVFLVSGLWHGANWTFVIWGALHGIYVVSGNITKQYRSRLAHRVGLNSLPNLHKFLNAFWTFCLVVFAWIFFRANNLTDALYICRNLFSGYAELTDWQQFLSTVQKFSGNYKPELLLGILGIIFMELVHWRQRPERIRVQLKRQPVYVRWAGYTLLTLAIIFLGVFNETQFIYFQF